MSKIKNPLLDDILIIDHIAYYVDQEVEDSYFSSIRELFQPTGYLKRPHLTIAYSPLEIEKFPIRGLEGEIYFQVPKKHRITIQDEGYYRIHVDHHLQRHLVLDLSHREDIVKQHEFYLKRGALWFIGQYSPFLIIESNTTYQEEDLQHLPLYKERLTFPWVRYSRFGELKAEPSK